MATRIQIRRDTVANWTSVNPVLAGGEFGLETDTGLLKIGDGATVWNSLEYAQSIADAVSFDPFGSVSSIDVQSAIEELDAEKAPLAGPFAPSSTGAVAATRYVGGTASVAPTTGTFAIGDWVVTRTGKIYICTVAGTPGTWVLAQSGTTEAVNVVAASGATETIPEPSVATISRIVLTADCTLTFPTAAAGKSFTLVLVQDGTGSRLITWPGIAKWPGGVAPTLSTGINKADYFSFVCTDGTNFDGFTSGLDLR